MSIEATHDQALTPAAPADAVIHPLWVRLIHWVNFLAAAVMIGSGWEIYNVSPLFPFVFPRGITLGGWLAGALLWHFAAMWNYLSAGLIRYETVTLPGLRTYAV
jgi:thiosulfate reductase cytochrome b subunit